VHQQTSISLTEFGSNLRWTSVVCPVTHPVAHPVCAYIIDLLTTTVLAVN